MVVNWRGVFPAATTQFHQDQSLDRVDFSALHERLVQNGAQERLTAQWVDRALRRLHARGAAA